MSIVEGSLVSVINPENSTVIYDFKPTGSDYTVIVMNTYDVNDQPQYEEWIDANYKVHRVLTRQKIEGNFQVKFTKKEDIEEFMQKFGDPSHRHHPIYLKVFVNNRIGYQYEEGEEGQYVKAYFYVDYTTKNELPYMDGGKEESLEGFTINISEV